MYLFCMVFIPVFLAWRTSLAGSASLQIKTSALIALVLGTVYSLLRFSLGPLFLPHDFSGGSFWHQLVDIAALPSILPVAAYWAIYRRAAFDRDDGTTFALLWLVPVAIGYALQGYGVTDRSSLVYLPLLWMAVGSGLTFLIGKIRGKSIFIISLLLSSIIALPIAAAFTSWFFFLYRPGLGLLGLAICQAPAGADIALILRRRFALRTT